MVSNLGPARSQDRPAGLVLERLISAWRWGVHAPTTVGRMQFRVDANRGFPYILRGHPCSETQFRGEMLPCDCLYCSSFWCLLYLQPSRNAPTATETVFNGRSIATIQTWLCIQGRPNHVTGVIMTATVWSTTTWIASVHVTAPENWEGTCRFRSAPRVA